MRMMRERLPPGMKNGDKAELAAEMLGISADRLARLGHGVEQNGVDQNLVLIGDRRNLGGHGEYDVEIGHWQKVGFARGQPSFARDPLTLWAVPIAATIVRDPAMTAVVAGLDMAAERGGPAPVGSPPCRPKMIGLYYLFNLTASLYKCKIWVKAVVRSRSTRSLLALLWATQLAIGSMEVLKVSRSQVR